LTAEVAQNQVEQPVWTRRLVHIDMAHLSLHSDVVSEEITHQEAHGGVCQWAEISSDLMEEIVDVVRERMDGAVQSFSCFVERNQSAI